MCGTHALVLLLCFTAFLLEVYCDCPLESPGYCDADNEGSHRYNKSESIRSLCALNCDFEENLCFYVQGCINTNMTEWKVSNGSATADQPGGGCGALSFTMLESPWVSITTQPSPTATTSTTTANSSCLRFSFTRRLPYGLDVFWVAEDGNVSTLLNRSMANSVEATYRHAFTLEKGIGKLMFRLYGGGGFSGDGERKLLSLHEITHTWGQCELPECSFDTADQNCGWANANWETQLVGSNVTGNKAAFSMGSNTTELLSTLKTPFLRPSNSVPDCLKFLYMITPGSSNTSLTIKVQLLSGQTVSVWTVNGSVNGSQSMPDQEQQVWRNGSFPVLSPYAYRIFFESRTTSPARIGLDDIIVTPSKDSCIRQPSDSMADSLPVEAVHFCNSKGNEIIITTTTAVTTAMSTTSPTTITSSVISTTTTLTTTTNASFYNTTGTTQSVVATTPAFSSVSSSTMGQNATEVSTLSPNVSSTAVGQNVTHATTSLTSSSSPTSTSGPTANAESSAAVTDANNANSSFTQLSSSAQPGSVSSQLPTSSALQASAATFQQGNEDDKKSAIIAGVICGFVGLVIVSLAVYCLIRIRRKHTHTYSVKNGIPLASPE